LRTYRTLLEQKIREKPQTLQEFVDFAEVFARQHNEPGSIGLRHLKRLVTGRKASGEPLGPTLQPATARLLEQIFEVRIEELLSPPKQPEFAEDERPVRDALELAAALDWLDERAEWQPGTSRSKVRARLAELELGRLLDVGVRRARVGRTAVTRALVDYYGDNGLYRAVVADAEIVTSVISRAGWLDLACPLEGDDDRLVFAEPSGDLDPLSDAEASAAVSRLAESVKLGVRLANLPLYRLWSVDLGRQQVQGRVGVVPFVEYALTADLLERELVDAVASGYGVRRMPLRDKHLPRVVSGRVVYQRR
jgi:hypothetical protein